MINYHKDINHSNDLIYKLMNLISLIKAKKIKLLAIIFLSITFAVIYTKKQKTVYKASLSYTLEEDNSTGNGGLIGIASQLGLDASSAGASGGMFSKVNLVNLLRSRLIIEQVLLSKIHVNGDSISLAKFYLNINNKKNAINILLNNNPDVRTFQQDSLLKIIYLDLSSEDKLEIGQQKDKKSSFTSVTVLNENEIFAKIFCEKLVEITSNFYIKTKSAKARVAVQLLQKQVDSVRGELENSFTDYASANDNIFNLNPIFSQKGTKPLRKKIDIEANSTLLTSLVSNLEIAKMQLNKETPLIQVIDKPTLPLDKIEQNLRKNILISIFIFISISSLFWVIKDAFLNVSSK